MTKQSQFAGLEMKELIEEPLIAAANASVQLAQSAAKFVNEVSLDVQKKVSNAQFDSTEKNENLEETNSTDDTHINIPRMSIVPIPNILIDEMNISFDMEVKENQENESSQNLKEDLLE